MKHWKSTTDVKKIQRHVNRCIRHMNKVIEEDELWRGRFFARQIERYVRREKDWVQVGFHMRFYDKKTKITQDFYYQKTDFFICCHKPWLDMNNFIVETCNVWQEDPRPSIKDAIDYRHMKE